MDDLIRRDEPPPGPAKSVPAAAARETVRPRAAPRAVRSFTADLSAVGEPALWGLGGALALGIILIASFLAMIFWNGIVTFWPKPIVKIELRDGTILAGEPSRESRYRPGENVLARLTPEQRAFVEENGGFSDRVLYRTANFDLYGDDFRWVSDFEVAGRSYPEDFLFFERQEWGPFVGRIAGLVVDDRPVPRADITLEMVHDAQREARRRFNTIRRIERGDIGAVNYRIEQQRLATRRAALRHGADSRQAEDAAARSQETIAALQAEFDRHQARVAEIRAVLLAGLRSAVLWRQLKGGYLDLLLRRRQIAEASREWLDHG